MVNEKVMQKDKPSHFLGMFWDGTYGVISGDGYKAYAEDFPEGAKIEVTAKVIQPNPSNQLMLN